MNSYNTLIDKLSLPLLAAVVSLGLLTGCSSLPHRSSIAPSRALSTRNNCLSLLHQLFLEQKDVSLLHFIKPEHSDVKDLLKQIAASSGEGAKLLERLAQEDPTIQLDHIDLPSGEVATRDSIAASKKEAILFHTGQEFELTLLLSQAEALSYAWHLAKVAGQNEPQPDRARQFADLSVEMENLYRGVFTTLLLRGK